MCSQIHQDLIGRKAKMGMAVMPGGIKIIIFRELGNNRARFGWWPPDQSLFDYSRPENKTDFYHILVEIARISSVKLPSSKANDENTVAVNTAALHTPSTPKSRKRLSSPPTGTKNQNGESSSGPRTRRRNGENSDTTIIMIGKDGSESVRFHSLDVNSRFNAEEITKPLQIHNQKKLQISISDFSGYE